MDFILKRTLWKSYQFSDDLEEGKIAASAKFVKGDCTTHRGQIFCLAISPNDRYLVTGGSDAIIRVWNFVNLQHVKNLTGHMNAITGWFPNRIM